MVEILYIIDLAATYLIDNICTEDDITIPPQGMYKYENFKEFVKTDMMQPLHIMSPQKRLQQMPSKSYFFPPFINQLEMSHMERNGKELYGDMIRSIYVH